MVKRRLGIAYLSPEEVEKLGRRHPELAAVSHAVNRQAITIVAAESVEV